MIACSRAGSRVGVGFGLPLMRVQGGVESKEPLSCGSFSANEFVPICTKLISEIGTNSFAENDR